MDLSATLDRELTGHRPRADWDTGRLSGTRCAACRAASWPARSVCYRCGSPDVTAVQFEATGSLLTYTSVWVPRPGLQTPYMLGQVHLDDGPVVFAHVRNLPEGATVPCRVTLQLAPDPGSTPWYWFEPVGPVGRSATAAAAP